MKHRMYRTVAGTIIMVSVTCTIVLASVEVVPTRTSAKVPPPEPATPSTRIASPSTVTEDAMPFGLRKGMTKAQLGAKEQVAPGMYKLSRVPKPHPDFEFYVVQIGPTTGLCFVKAVGNDVITSVYGTEIKAQYKKIRDQVASTYGNYRERDLLLPGSIWNELNDWSMALFKKERVLMASWNLDSGATLRRGLRDVYVNASAARAGTGYVSVEYYFDTETQCQKEIDNASGSVF